MYQKTMTYKDFLGEEITEDLYFNISKTEISKSNFSTAGGVENKLRKMVNEKNVQAISELFTELIGESYGILDADGKHFRKSPEIRAEFESSAAYDALYMELLQDTESALAFLKGILPDEIKGELDNNEEIKALVAKTKE